MKPRRFYIGTGLTLLLVSLYFMMPHEKKEALSTNRPPEYMKQASLWQYTETGSMKSTITARYWAYLPAQGISTLESPHLIIYKPDNTRWYIQAKLGWVKQPTLGKIEEITLEQGVSIERPTTPFAKSIQIETEKLQYRPETQYAETDTFIKMIKPECTVTGIGMRAFLDRNYVELLHNVKTHYVVNQKEHS